MNPFEELEAIANSTTRDIKLYNNDLTRGRRAAKTNLQSAFLGANKTGNRRRALRAKYELLFDSVDDARTDVSIKAYAHCLDHLASIIEISGQLRNISNTTVKKIVKALYGHINPVPKYHANFIRGARTLPGADEVFLVTGMNGGEWMQSVACIQAEYESRERSGVPISDALQYRPFARSLAQDLIDLNRDDPDEGIDVALDYNEDYSNLKIESVSIAGFRGVKRSLTVDFTTNGAPRDVLLWGSNGHGKSTIIDALEFGLQATIDRTTSYTSEFHPSARNVSSSETSVSVSLSDGRRETREILKDDLGKDSASSSQSSPGFTVSPLVIRRADILRFLSAESLTRSMIFFDYFPAPGQADNVRPDERLRQLNEEQIPLRVARSRLASDLEKLYDLHPGSLTESPNNIDKEVELRLSEFDTVPVGDRFGLLPKSEQQLILEFKQVASTYRANKQKINRGVQKLNPVAYKEQQSRLSPILQRVSPRITSAFKDISRLPHVSGLEIVLGKTGPASLDVVVTFMDGSSSLAQQSFSEGYNDLIALLFFIEMLRESGNHGQAKVLVLDDALQSVDAQIRIDFMDYVLGSFSGWQIIVTGHDRAWLQQLQDLFRSHSRDPKLLTITRWSFEDGPVFKDVSTRRVSELERSLRDGNYHAISSLAGVTLEEISEELSWRLRVKVVRAKFDRYTLGQLWPPVARKLIYFGLGRLVSEVDRYQSLRNISGAHYSFFSDSVSPEEVKFFGEGVVRLYRSVYCESCRDWISLRSGSLSCNCSKLSYENRKI